MCVNVNSIRLQCGSVLTGDGKTHLEAFTGQFPNFNTSLFPARITPNFFCHLLKRNTVALNEVLSVTLRMMHGGDARDNHIPLRGVYEIANHRELGAGRPVGCDHVVEAAGSLCDGHRTRQAIAQRGARPCSIEKELYRFLTLGWKQKVYPRSKVCCVQRD